MFDIENNKQMLATSLDARRQLASLISRTNFDGPFNCVVKKRVARSISRAVDLFDDTYLMLDNGRLTSAIVLARSFFEQVAYTAHIVRIATDHRNDLVGLESMLIELDQSSEQRQRLFKQADPNLQYTTAASAKLRTKTPSLRPKQLIESLQWVMTAKGDEEGKARLIYSGLCEWSHPTLFSVVHAYTRDVPPTLTSVGLFTSDQVRKAFVIQSLAFMVFLYAMWTEPSDDVAGP